MPLRIVLARAIALLLLLPAGLICVGVPVWMLTLPGRTEIFGDTSAAFGGGRDAGRLRASYVDCVRERSGSNSGRGIGMTEYGCVIDLTDAPEPAPAPAATRPANPAAKPGEIGGDPYAGLTQEQATEKWNAVMEDHTRSINAGIESLAAQRRARADTSNRLERKLATNRTNQLPAVRILSAPGETPRRIGLVWGFGELAWRWGQWLATSVLMFGFGGGCLFAVWVAWKRPRTVYEHSG